MDKVKHGGELREDDGLGRGVPLQHAPDLLSQGLDLRAALEGAAAHAPQDARLLAHRSCHSSWHLHQKGHCTISTSIRHQVLPKEAMAAESNPDQVQVDDIDTEGDVKPAMSAVDVLSGRAVVAGALRDVVRPAKYCPAA